MVYTLLFSSSKCSLFHNSNVFGFCIIHILYTGVLKLKKIIPAPKVNHCATAVPYINNDINNIQEELRGTGDQNM